MKEKGKFTAPLIAAAKEGDFNSVLGLAAAGGDITATDDDGNTLLMIAIKHGHGGLAYFLVTAGVDIKATNKNGDTTLSLCIQYNCREKLFIQTAGAC